MQEDLTTGSVGKNLARFSIPYLASCFLQSFYGMADLFITGKYNGAEVISAVAIGSQLMHMLTVMVVGFAMGTTVNLGKAVGANDKEQAGKVAGNSALFFALLTVPVTLLLTFLTDPILSLLSTPAEAFQEAHNYLFVCMLGIPWIVAYNVAASLFRGQGDSKTPLYFIALAGLVNIFLDWLFIGPMGMGAMGAALATVISQAISFICSFVALLRMGMIKPRRSDFKFEKGTLGAIVGVGIPICAQDGFIQVSFLLITAFVNQRGVVDAAAVGIVEKIISFLFLVPSAMLSSVSVLAAQNAGAGRNDRSLQTLWLAMAFSATFGLAVSILVQFFAGSIVGFFTTDPQVIEQGTDYFRTYVLDCFFASFHFTMGGFFCAYEKAGFSFLSNFLANVLIRIPGAWWASHTFTTTLLPLGAVAPLGSVFSSLICVVLMVWLWKKGDIRK